MRPMASAGMSTQGPVMRRPAVRLLRARSGTWIWLRRYRFAGRDQAGFVGEDDGLGAVAEVELGQDPADVGLGGLLGDDQRVADLGIGQTVGDQPQHLGLARSERAEGGLDRRAGAWLAGEVGDQPP